MSATQWVLWNLPSIIAFTVMFTVGGLLFPAAIYLLDEGYPDLLSGLTLKLYWVAGALAFGRYVAYERDNRSYELLAAEPCTDADGDPAHKVWPDGPDGEPVVVKGGAEDMYRLGLRKFGVCAAKSARQMESFGAEKRDSAAAGGAAVADGGSAVLDETRQGYWAFDHTLSEGETGWILPLRRKKHELTDAGGADLFLRSMMDAIVKEGGDKRLPQWMLYGLGFMCLVFGALSTFATVWVMG